MDSARAARAGMLDRLTEVVRAAGEEIESAHHALEQLEQASREALTPEHVLAEALDAARAIETEDRRTGALTALVSRLPEAPSPRRSMPLGRSKMSSGGHSCWLPSRHACQLWSHRRPARPSRFWRTRSGGWKRSPTKCGRSTGTGMTRPISRRWHGSERSSSVSTPRPSTVGAGCESGRSRSGSGARAWRGRRWTRWSAPVVLPKGFGPAPAAGREPARPSATAHPARRPGDVSGRATGRFCSAAVD